MSNRISGLNRRRFLKTGLRAAAGAAALGSGLSKAALPGSKEIPLTGTIPTRPFGKTGHTLPVLGHGGSAMVQQFIAAYGARLLPDDELVAMVRQGFDKGIRYFDTARVYGKSEGLMGRALKDVRDQVYVATKVAVSRPEDVRRSVETSLTELQTDYVDAMQIHSPVIERAGVQGAMAVHAELLKLREEGLLRFIGLTTHVAFENVYELIATGGFDQVLLGYGYFPRELTGLLSDRKRMWREKCLAKAHELQMGVVAMKVLGADIFSHNATNLVPDYEEAARDRLAAAAVRWVLSDPRVSVLNIGVSYPDDIDRNIRTLAGDLTLTNEDRALLADYSARAFETERVKAMRVA